MLNRRLDSPAIRIAIVCCFALAILPRATVYTHQHAGETQGHVHAWDGARLDSVRELIDETRGGHDHAHPHAHDADDHHHHDRDVAPERAQPSVARKDAAHGPAYAAAGASERHAHAQAPFQSVARTTAAPLPFDRLQIQIAAAAAMEPRALACAAPGARAPPLSVQA